ncbi:hypothetical protein P9J64_12885 [Deltaproteobacteria bacterium IMCC39524]|nr:hypothetical protein [Deltaproteobacteria bacterium IMCC39524]
MKVLPGNVLSMKMPESKKKERPRVGLLVNAGRNDWIRTNDTLLPNPLGNFLAQFWFALV